MQARQGGNCRNGHQSIPSTGVNGTRRCAVQFVKASNRLAKSRFEAELPASLPLSAFLIFIYSRSTQSFAYSCAATSYIRFLRQKR